MEISSLERQQYSRVDAGIFTKLGFRVPKYWTQNYINCSKRRAFFVSGLVFSHALAENSVMCILISYFTKNWKKNRLIQAAEVVNVEGGVSAIMAIILSFVADAYLCRFKVIACTTILCIIGLMLLGVSTWLTPAVEVRCFYPIVLLIAVGKAGRKGPLKAFLFDQWVDVKENLEIDEEEVEAQQNLWWQLAWSLGLLASFFLSVYSWSWRRTFLTSAIVMAMAYVWFWCGIRFYCYNKPTASHLTVVFKVFKAAVLKRNLAYPNIANGYFNNHSHQLPLCPNVPFIRWLDKAAIIEQSTDELSLQEQELKGRLCSAAYVKQVKCLLTIIPIWTTFVVYGMVEATGRTFFIEQSKNLDNNIGSHLSVPVTLFKLKSMVTLVLSLLLKLLIPKRLTGTKRQHIIIARMGLGMIFSLLSCISAWQVEVHRLNFINNEIKCDERTIIPMSVFWLVPQFTMLGLMAGFAEDGFRDLVYNQGFAGFEKLIFESCDMDCAMGIGNLLSLLFAFIFSAWIGDNINSSRLDKYFLLLAILNIGNIFLYCFVIVVLYKFLCKEEGKQENGKLHLDGNYEDGNAISVSENC